MDSSSITHPVIAVIGQLNKVLSSTDEEILQRENPRKIVSFIERIHSLFLQIETVCSEEQPPITTELQRILIDLHRLSDILLLYKSKSRLFLLIRCRTLNEKLKNLVYSIAKWLDLLSLRLRHKNELCKGITDLASEMRRTQFMVSEIEERICASIDEEINDGTTEEAALMSDIAQALGMASHNRRQLSLQMELLKKDIQDSSGVHDMHIVGILEKVFRNGSVEAEVALTIQPLDEWIEEEETIPPFKTFICPLSKEVMKNPVVLETEQTYEQSEIEKWFKYCLEQGRKPTCPVTGHILSTPTCRKNLVLQNTIEEWVDRNIKTRILKVKQKLELCASIKDFERAVEEVYRISEETSINRYMLRTEGIIPLLLAPWQAPLKDNGHQIRSKALVALHSMAVKNEDNMLAMVEANVVKYAVRSLTSSLMKERESAAWLLRELSSHPEIAVRIGCQKGAVLLLTGLSNNIEYAALADLADQILKRLEEQHLNVIPMAEAGRLKPLLDFLCEGAAEVRLQMAKHLSQMTLSNNDKEQAVRQTALVLVEMLSSDLTEKEAALKALLMLSTPDDNASVLVNSGILPPLVNFIKSVHPMSHNSIIQLKDVAAEILANLVSKPGHWEDAVADSDGNTLQSEPIIHCLLNLMTRVGYRWKHTLLQVVYSIASSSHAADAAVTHIHSGSGIKTLVVLISDNESRHYALKLLHILSLRKGADVAAELKQTGKLTHMKESLKDSENLEERATIACILANIPLTEADILQVLEIELLSWTVVSLKNVSSGQLGRSGSTAINMMEGLLGLILHFCRTSNPSILEAIKEQKLMMVFKDQLVFPGHPSLKKLAAEGLQILSQKTVARNDLDPSTSCGWFLPFVCLSRRKAPASDICHVHGIPCEKNNMFCLVKTSAIMPLVEMLEEADPSVQSAAIGALSTLLDDSINLRAGVEELKRVEAIHRIFNLFFTAQPGELQEKTLWMIERIVRIEELSRKYSIDQILIKTLVQAFKAGSPTTRTLAQTALTSLNQISGASSGAVKRTAVPPTRLHE